MTFCLGIRVKDGVVALADTRVTSGNEVIVARKVSTFHQEKRAAFIMTSGLRSVRDKAITYFDEAWSRPDPALDRLFKVVNLFAAQVRKVADEDRAVTGGIGKPRSHDIQPGSTQQAERSAGIRVGCPRSEKRRGHRGLSPPAIR